MKIGLDISGGDFYPNNCLDGAIMALDSLPNDVKIVLIGDSEKAKNYLKEKQICLAWFYKTIRCFYLFFQKYTVRNVCGPLLSI